MDQRQRNLLNSATRELADTIDFEQISELLQLANIVSQEKLDEIKASLFLQAFHNTNLPIHIYNLHPKISVSKPYCRNLKLLNALQESELRNVFDEFVQILEITQNTRALELICSSNLDKQRRVDGTRGILNKLAVKYGRFKTSFSSSHHHKFPLGLTSASFSNGRLASAMDGQGSSAGGEGSDSSYVNPLKEKHRATLVTSAGGTSTSNNSSTTSSPLTNIDSANQEKILSEFSKMLPSVSTNISSSSFNTSSKTKLKPHQINSTSQTPRTTRRPSELRIEGLHLNNQQETSTGDAGVGSGGGGDEPVVCWHPYAQSQSGESSPHNCLRSCASSYDSDSSSDSMHHFHDSTLVLDTDVTLAIAKEEANTMFVQTATVLHNNHEEDYKMTAKPRGICLIVNNIDFDGDIFPTRTGSDIDAKRFDEVFTQLFFTVVMRRNLTAEQMKDTFKEVASKCKKEHDAFFVFILSHGSEHGIFGIDGIEVSLENDIISPFDNRNCKPLRGKPKVFVIQACRGRAIDYGGEGDMTDSIGVSPVAASTPIVTAAVSQNRVPNSWLPNTRPQECKKREPPTRTDMLLVFSCLAGFVSVRNELWGSWLGVAFSYFLMKHAHEKDLLKILNFVTDDITQRKSAYGHVQSTEVKLLGWKKNLFFNPGL